MGIIFLPVQYTEHFLTIFPSCPAQSCYNDHCSDFVCYRGKSQTY